MAARDRMADTGEPYSRARRAAGKSWPRLRDSSVNWHFVALGGHHGFGPWGQHATVRDASTGAVTAIVPTPEALRRFDRVTSAGAPGAASSCTCWPVTANPETPPARGHPVSRGAGSAAVRAAGRRGRAGRRPGPGSRGVAAARRARNPSMAVRADGTGLLCAQTQHRGRSWETVVYTVNLATGEPRVLAEAVPGPVTELSWAADARTVAFEWNPAMGRAGARQAGIYMTDPAGPRQLGEAGSRLVTPSDDGLGPLVSPVISRDGTAVYVTATRATSPAGRIGTGCSRSRPAAASRASCSSCATRPIRPTWPTCGTMSGWTPRAGSCSCSGSAGPTWSRSPPRPAPHPLPGVRARNPAAAGLFHNSCGSVSQARACQTWK